MQRSPAQPSPVHSSQSAPVRQVQCSPLQLVHSSQSALFRPVYRITWCKSLAPTPKGVHVG